MNQGDKEYRVTFFTQGNGANGTVYVCAENESQGIDAALNKYFRDANGWPMNYDSAKAVVTHHFDPKVFR